MLRCTVGSTGAEDLASARLTSFLEHSTLNAPMPNLKPSVQPVLHLIFPWRSDLYQSEGVGSSDNHRMHRCLGIGSSGATYFSRTRPIQRFFENFFSCFALHGLFTSSLGSRNVYLTKQLILLIALSFDHQNHSKWHEWCHVRYNVFTM